MVPLGMGVNVKLRISTMTVTGSTEVSASEIFSLSFFRIAPPLFLIYALSSLL